MEASKRTGVFVWGGIAAAAAGIFAVVVVMQLRERKKADTGNLRDVQEVLADCYQKIREIEEHLPGNIPAASDLSSRISTQVLSNGKPVLDAG